MDVLAAAPATGPTKHPMEYLVLLLLLLLLLLRPRQVQGAALPGIPYSWGSRVMWMSVGVDSGMFRSARICNRLKYRSLRVPYTCRGLAT